MREEDIPEVSEENFAMSQPQTRESAIISLADMVEKFARWKNDPGQD